MNVELEGVLAALIDQNEGELFLGSEFIAKDYAGKAIAIQADALRDGWVMSLVNVKEVQFED